MLADEHLPDWAMNVIRLLNSMSPSEGAWKRLRVAVTQAELQELRKFFIDNPHYGYFVHYLRGVPLVIEDHPLEPPILMEYP